MYVKLVDHTQSPEEVIAKMAAICYNSSLDDASNDRRVKHLLSVGHLSTLRFAYATFLVEGVSRICTHQLVRHPHLSFLQESQRYVKQAEASVVVPPAIEKDKELLIAFGKHMRQARELYQLMVDCGVRKEDARFALPQACTSKIYITGNFQAWHDFLRSRTDKKAQWEVREVALEIEKQLQRIAPNVFGESDKAT